MPAKATIMATLRVFRSRGVKPSLKSILSLIFFCVGLNMGNMNKYSKLLAIYSLYIKRRDYGQNEYYKIYTCK